MDNDETPVAVEKAALEKAAAERLRKSESARAKRKAVKDTVTIKTENEYAKARRARKNRNWGKHEISYSSIFMLKDVMCLD